MATVYTWPGNIPNSDIDADSPLTADLFADIRDGISNLAERVGTPGTYNANIEDHDHDGTNSAQIDAADITGSFVIGNPDVTGGQFEGRLADGTLASPSWTTISIWRMFVPSGVKYVYVVCYCQAATGSSDFRIALEGATGTNYSAVLNLTSSAAQWALFRVDGPATTSMGGPQNTTTKWYRLRSQARNVSGTGTGMGNDGTTVSTQQAWSACFWAEDTTPTI